MPPVRTLSSVGLGEQLDTGFFQGANELKPLLSFYHRGRGVLGPAEGVGDVQAQEIEAVNTLHHSPVDMQGLWGGAFSRKSRIN